MQRKVLMAVIVIALSLGTVLSAWFGGKWLWEELATYVRPGSATERKELVNIFVLIAAGVVGTLTAIAAVGNLIISRMNLQNAQATLQLQRDLDDRRAQETALQAYLQQITSFVREGLRDEHPLSPVRLLVRSQTLNVFWQLDPMRKRALLQTLREADLIRKEIPVIGLSGADLRQAYLRDLDLGDSDLRGADMKDVNLEKADLTGADLSGADLSGANLSGAEGITNEQLEAQARHLAGATMPDGSKHS